MLIFGGKLFTATAAGQRLETVVCEKCSTKYHYIITRLATGKGSAPYMVGQQAANERAVAASRSNLEKRLGREAEMVPCPKCHWVNEDLVRRYRRTLYRWMGKFAWIIPLAIFFLAIPISMSLYDQLGYNSKVPRDVQWSMDVLALLSPVIVLLVRHHLRQKVDPNRTYPRSPRLPAGTPPAMLERVDPQSGEVVLEPVANQPRAPRKSSEWAVFRPGQVVFPPVCCICLSQASKSYKEPFRISQSDLQFKVPLCKACARGLKLRWCAAGLVIVAVTTAVSGLLMLVIPGSDVSSREFLFGGLSLFTGGLGLSLFPNWVCRPYRFDVVDGERGVVRLSAKNQSYTEMLIEQVRLSNARSVLENGINRSAIVGVQSKSEIA
jgi:hypothetical protein